MAIITMKAILQKLVHTPDAFSTDDAKDALNLIMDGKAEPSQISAFLVALRLQHKDSDPDIVNACATVVREKALPIPFDESEILDVVDIVGTGGDGHNTYNVSTTASIVAAGAGAKVAKHGNRAASSKSGSADLLEANGCNISNVDPARVAQILLDSDFCFLFSQLYHPAMKHVATVRKEIGLPTVFNMLGPMSNPAKPKYVVVGVHSPEIGGIMAKALKISGVQEALVVCGAERLDEISPAGDTHFWRASSSSEEIITGVLHPERDFGLQTHPLEEVKGGDGAENSAILNKLLNGELAVDDPILDFVLLNASALLVISGKATDYKHGVALARDAVMTGKAREALEKFRKASTG